MFLSFYTSDQVTINLFIRNFSNNQKYILMFRDPALVDQREKLCALLFLHRIQHDSTHTNYFLHS